MEAFPEDTQGISAEVSHYAARGERGECSAPPQLSESW